VDLPANEAKSLQHHVARDRFAVALAKAMDDGVLDDNEASYLEEISQSVECTLGEFVGQYFQAEGENFLRGMFAACTEGGELADDVWDRLLKTTQRLGMSNEVLAAAILPQSERFVEHVLADAKSDGVLSENEDAQLTSLIKKLALPPSSQSYFARSLAALRTIRLASQGKLPVVRSPLGTAIRSGEIVHLHEPARWNQRRILRNGDRWEEHFGDLTITDNRLLFSSDTKSFDVRFSRIVRHSGSTGEIRLQRMEKPESVIQLTEDEPIAYAILEGAIALANQTRLTRQGGTPTRHIPREIRQRVWQRYGGRCAECSAAQYLEFDHIIPVAKGGSNSDTNVQLLCRGCNLKKSDRI
jgi:hypothetical protein